MPDIPILAANDILIVSIQRDPTDSEAEDLQHRLLERVAKGNARGVAIDLSGMDVVDSYFCRILRDMAAMVRLMGARTAVVGIPPAVAVTLIELGLTLEGVHTDLTLDRGLAWLRATDG